MFSHFSSTSPRCPGCSLKGQQEVVAEGQCCTPQATLGHFLQLNQPSWLGFLAEVTSQDSPVPHLTTSGASSQ